MKKFLFILLVFTCFCSLVACDGKIKDYQMSSLLMAITINDMTDEEWNIIKENQGKEGL